MFVTTPGVNAQSNLPRKNSSGSGSAKLSKLFNLQLFLKRVERAFSFVWSFRGPGCSAVVPSLLLASKRRRQRRRRASLGCCLACRFPPGRSVSPRETFSVLVAAMPVAHVTPVARRRRCVTTIVAYFFTN